MRASRLHVLMISSAVILCVLAAVIVIAAEQGRTLARLGSSLRALESRQAAGASENASVEPGRRPSETMYAVEGHDVYMITDDHRTLLIKDAPELSKLPGDADLLSFYVRTTDGETYALLAESGTLAGPAPGGNVWKLRVAPEPPLIADTGIANRQWQVFLNDPRAVGYGKPDANGEVRAVYMLDLARQRESMFASLPSNRSFTASLNSFGEPIFSRGWDQVHPFFGTQYVFPVYAVGELLRPCEMYNEACTYRAPVAFRIFSEGQ